MNRAIRFKFGTEMEDGPLLRMDHKSIPKWAWPGSRDPSLRPPNNLRIIRAIYLKFSTDSGRTLPADGL